jgi:hypothetical protein
LGAEHIEVEVGFDVVGLTLREPFGVAGRAQQAELLRSQNAKRRLLSGSIPSSSISSAISRIVEEPLSLSLIPGPSGTESKCAPTITVRSVRPVLVSATTFEV